MSEFLQKSRLFSQGLLQFLVFCSLLLHPNVDAQANQPSLDLPVNISGKNIPLAQVLKAIKKQTGFTFFYSNQLLDDKEKISLDFKHARLEDVLTFLFKDRNIRYEVRGTRLLLNEKPIPAKTVTVQSPEPLDKKVADTGHVKGQVMDVDGKPLVNATVSVKGTPGRVSVTDEFGIFAIVARPGEILSISMVSMQTEEIVVPAKGTINATLKVKKDNMDEAVVVGYGKQKKLTVTGAVSSVNMADMRTPVPSLSNALAGKVAGIISVQSSGEPGYDNSTFTIRGISTFTGNSSPLIIVDGVQREDVNSTYGGAFNNIDPEDVASISLLKDASSTAMYGAKGANGVLIITTKRGQAGKAKISLKAETGMTGFTKTPKMLDGVNYMKLLNEAKVNSGSAPLYSDEQIQKTASGLDPYLYPNVNWIDAVYRKSSSLTNVNLNVNGGSEAVRYYLSASFYNQDGPYKVSNQNGFNPNLNFKRYDFRSNVDVNITKTTLLQMNLGAMLVNSKYPGISAANLWYISYATTPVGFPTKYPDGKWAGPVNNGGNNPLNEVQNDGYSTEFRPSVQSVFTVTQKLDVITKGLSAYGRFSFDSYGEFDNSRTHANDLWNASGRDAATGQLLYNQTRVGSQFLGYSQSSTGERIMYLEGNINYEKSFGDHHIGAMVLYNMRNRLVSTAGDVIGSIPYRNEALAGRLTYSYNDRYLAEVNAGYTGSENFEPGKKFGFFPAVSAGWVISKERFFDAASRNISLLKIRGSYGIVGNDQIGDPTQVNRFPYLTQIGGGNTAGFGLNGTEYYGQTENVIGVQNLTWEKSYKSDLGLEIGILNKLNIIADIFKDRRKNILIQRGTVASIAGYNGSRIFANLGEMNNLGMDASVEYNDKIGKVGLRLFGNVTYSHNKIVFQDEPARKYAYQRGTGHQYGEFTGYIDDGLFKDQNDVNSSPVQTFNPVYAGDIKYKNLNPKDDNVIDTYDWEYLGKSWFPTWLYGAGFTVSYHNFDLSLFFQGTFGSSIMANGSWFAGNGWGADGVGVVPFSGIGQYPNNTLANVEDRWTPANPRQNAYYPRLTMGSLSDNNYLSSTRWLKNGDYLRLKQSSIGYTLSSATLKKGGLSSLYFYLSGQNLLTFSKFKLWDPEMGSNGAKYPITRMVTCGIRAQF